MEPFDRINPWWYYDNWLSKDKHLSEWSSQRYRWIPRWIDHLSLKPFSLNFVYGTRQTGKTTGLKLLIKRMIEERHVSPLSIFYLDLDLIASFQEFRSLVQDLLREKKRRGLPAYIFLDEVSSVEEWWRVIKFYIDSGEFAGDVITVSGSSTVGLLKAPEMFPGRTGEGSRALVLPLAFHEYVEATGWKKEDLMFDRDRLLNLFQEYKRKGGFPKSINGHKDAEEALLRGIVSEIYRHHKSIRISQDIIHSILQRIPSALSYNSIATDIGISHNTVREYMEFLEDIFILATAYVKDNTNRVLRRREKKVFFRDPLIIKTLAGWVNHPFREDPVTESILQEHMLRRFGEVYYYRDHYEVDAIAGNYRVELKSHRPHRGYPKNITLLTEEEVPHFLLTLFHTGENP